MGIRACIGKLTKPVSIDRNGNIMKKDPRDAAAKNMSIESTIQAHRTYNGASNGRIQIWFGAVTPRSSDIREHHVQLAKTAKDRGIKITMHCAEASDDQKFYKDTFNESPMEYCCSTGLAGKGTVLAHMVHLEKRDIELLKVTGTNVAHNPASNCKLASGIAPIPDILDAGINVGLGCDGAPCNNSVDLLQEMRLASLIHRAKAQDASMMTAETVFEMATINGAKALGLDSEIGSIEIGKKADLVVLNLDNISNTPVQSYISSIVYTAVGGDVHMTMVDGKILVDNGILPNEDEIKQIGSIRAKAIIKRAGITIASKWPVK